MTNRHRNNCAHRIYALATLLSRDSRSAAGKVELIVKNARADSGKDALSIRNLIDALEVLEFGVPDEGSNTELSDLTDFAPTDSDPTDIVPTDSEQIISKSETVSDAQKDEPGTESVESVELRRSVLPSLNPPDEVTQDEAARLVQSRITAFILGLKKRDKYNLWVGIQPDLPERMELAQASIQEISLEITSELTPTEHRVYAGAIDNTVIRSACLQYFGGLEFRLSSSPELESIRDSLDLAEPIAGQPTNPVPPPGASTSARNFSFRRSLFYGFVIVVGAYGANWLYRTGMPGPPERDIIRMSIQASDRSKVDFPTTSMEQAERYILDRTGIRVRSPEIESASLLGVSLIDLPSDLEAPAFFYRDELTGDKFPIFVYSYAFVNRNSKTVDISPQIMNRIEDASKFGVRMTDEHAALVWRHRDDILIAIIRSNPDDLVDRIAIL
ncbi:MAG: hypothetical protein E2O84_02420 [Bacteroidetes bacterium]|nr:MAG: hypothetical protein E2O84_02420 [Bacteroidota bacterium]